MHIDWSQTWVRLVVAGRVQERPGRTTDPAWTGAMASQDLWFVFSGLSQTRTPEGPVDLHPGTCLWLKPLADWLYTTTWQEDDPLGNYFVRFDLLDLDGNLRDPDLPLPPDVLIPRDARVVEAVVHRIVELVLTAQHRDVWADAPQEGPILDAATALLTGLLMDLDACSDDDYGPLPSVAERHRIAMQEAATRLSGHPDVGRDIAKLAREMGYAPDYFARLFKRVTGMPPKTYALTARIHTARRLLRRTTLSVKEIAELTGYDSIFNFSRQFKKLTGKSPTAYREEIPRQENTRP